MGIKCLALFVCCFVGGTCGYALEYYVSPQGDDAGRGTLESPFATVARAQKEIRALPVQARKTNITVYLRGGEYRLENPLRFAVQDSAPDGYQYSYEAYEGECPVFTSALPLTGWAKANQLPSTLPADIADRVYVCCYPDHLEQPYVLYDGAKMVQRAKKYGFEIEKKNPIALEAHAAHEAHLGENDYLAARSMNVYRAQDRYLLSQFKFKDKQHVLLPWDEADEVEVAFAPVPWALNILPVKRVDVEAGLLYTGVEANAPAGAKPSHTKPWVENALEYISPGSFVTRGNLIYYCKAGDEKLEDLRMPTMIEYVLVEGDICENGADTPVRNLQFKGLCFTQSNRFTWALDHKGWGIQHDWDQYDCPNAMFRLRGAEDCTLLACRWTHAASSALRLDLHCQGISVKRCLIDDIGHMGIFLCGYGPGLKDVNRGNHICNNVIHHVGQIIKHGAGIFMWQSGHNVVAHNVIHHVPRKGIGVCGVRMPILVKPWCDFDEASKTIRWAELNQEDAALYRAGELSLGQYWRRCLPYLHARNNIIEYNEIYRALEALGDGSVINVSGAGEGNVVRQNYVHHIASQASGVLRTDDWQRGTLFAKNIIYYCNIAGIVHKGFNDVVGNMIVDCSCKEAIRWASYPDEEADYGSKVKHNLFYESEDKANFYRESYRASDCISRPDNTDTDFNLFCVAKNPADAQKHVKHWQTLGCEQHSVVADPLWLDGAKAPFTLRYPQSPAFALGFEPIEFDKIGLLPDYPKQYKALDVLDDGRKVHFHRQREAGKALYDFW